MAAVVFLSVVPSRAGTNRVARLTTTGGITYENVTLVRVEPDGVYIRHKSGGGRLSLRELTDDALRSLGLPSRGEMDARREKEREAQGHFEAEQKARGLVKYQGRWVTPARMREIEAEARERAYGTRADQLVMSKARRRAAFRVLQALPQGALCAMIDAGPATKGPSGGGELFLLLGATSAVLADGEEYTRDLYWAGTYTLVTVRGMERTLNGYSWNRNIALAAVRVKFSLYDSADPRAGPPSSTVPGNEAEATAGELQGFGSGFVVTRDGFVLTNCHVVNRAKLLKVRTEKGILPARVVGQDPENDMALLKIEGQFTPATFAPEKTARLGQTVFTVGFPMPELQGFSPKVTKGVISGLTGLRDDARTYQIDAAVQPGNSGGPLADENGDIVGVVVARLNDAMLLENTGAVAQNVNYSVKKSYAVELINRHADASRQVHVASEPKKMPFEEAVEKVRRSTVLVMVY